MKKSENKKNIEILDKHRHEQMNRTAHFAKETGSLAAQVITESLQGELDPEDYSHSKEINFEKNFFKELKDLVSALLSFEKKQELEVSEQQLAQTMLRLVSRGIDYVINKEDNPEKKVSNKWFEGVSLREDAEDLAEYFNRKGQAEDELDALRLKAKITTSIMGHYAHLVGPDMIAVAQKLEQTEKVEEALQFYKVIQLDFVKLVEQIEMGLQKGEPSLDLEDIPVVESLIYALEGLERLGVKIDEIQLLKARKILNQLR